MFTHGLHFDSCRWFYLESGLKQIMTNPRGAIDMKTYMSLYTAVHDFCTSARYVLGSSFHAANNRGGAFLLGEDLYVHLVEYLRCHLLAVQARAKECTDETLLIFYITEWSRYTAAAQYNNSIFRFLNRHWIRREMDEGKKNIYDVYTLHLVRWKEDVFVSTQESVIQSVLKLVERQRNGEMVELSYIKLVIDSFVTLGLDQLDSSRSTLDVYKEYFEKPFLEATAQHYYNESKRFLARNSVSDYMRKVESTLHEEKERVSLYLPNEAVSSLMRTCEQFLIANHSSTLREEFQAFLDHDRREDLGRMYKLLTRVSAGLSPLHSRFSTHVRKAGLGAVEQLAQNSDNLEPEAYIETLVEIHTQYQGLVNRAFNGNSEFVRSLDNACRGFVNHNIICKSGSIKSPELLVKYADTLLRKSSTRMIEDDDMENRLTQIMIIFKYIEDKDVFQELYSSMLAKRLIQTTSASNDAEISLISKLKEACGLGYTNSLQQMFQDTHVSRDLNTAYRHWLSCCKDKGAIDQHIDGTYHILETGSWPLNPLTTPFVPPQLIAKAHELFTTFYNAKYRGRKLTWLWELCEGELKANHLKVLNSKYAPTFRVSSYQMAILLLFNCKDTVSYDDLVERTQLRKETLDSNINVLIKTKVLTAQPEHAKPTFGVSYNLNYGFGTKRIKTDLNIGTESEQKKEIEDMHMRNDEDRKLLIQVCIYSLHSIDIMLFIRANMTVVGDCAYHEVS
jgi:cullin 1